MMKTSCGIRLTQTALWLLAAVLLPAATSAAQQVIRPALPGDTVFGLKLVDWAEAYIQWIVSIPPDVNPGDDTGLHVGVGQRSPVWFIQGSSNSNGGTRDFAIPEGQAIFLSATSIVQIDKPGSSTEEQLAVGPKQFIDQVTTVEVNLDAVPVSNMKQYRIRTPVFNVMLPPDNVFGNTVSTLEDQRQAAIADGYWLLFPPLAVGKHVLTAHIVGTGLDDSKYDSRWTFNLNIEKLNEASQ